MVFRPIDSDNSVGTYALARQRRFHSVSAIGRLSLVRLWIASIVRVSGKLHFGIWIVLQYGGQAIERISRCQAWCMPRALARIYVNPCGSS
jgi:hypothetical protein